MQAQVTLKYTLFLTILAFIFSFIVRLIWVYQFNGYEPFMFNNEFIINTNDGYYWAEGARDILSGAKELNYNSPANKALAQVTASIVKIMPVSFETVIFYMSAVFGSFIVVPLVLIGKTLNKVEIGFIAALIASVTWSYYNRTMVGYFDTDMLNIVFPIFLLWSLMTGLSTREDKYIFYTALIIVLYRWWYYQSYSIEFAFFGSILIYLFYLMYKKSKFDYELKLLTIILLAMVNLPGIMKLFMIVGLFMIFRKRLLDRYLFYIFGASIGLFLFTGGFDPIWNQVYMYLFESKIAVNGDALPLHFYTVIQTIREASQIPFDIFANRISGHTITFLLSSIGYIWLSFKHRGMLLALPLVGLGFLAYAGGLRFTIYAVPPMALGIAYLIYKISNLSVKPKNYIFMVLLTALVLVPNIIHVVDYKIPPVFDKNEVEVLDKMKSIANRDDYMLSWWDYGYPIRYYSDVNTIIDGGCHEGSMNFPFSYAMKSKQEIAVNVLRADVEYEKKRVSLIKQNRKLSKRKKKIIEPNITRMITKNSFKDANDFLAFVESGGEIKMLSKSGDIYLFLPNDMLGIFPTISKFSEIDLMSGKMGKEPFFFMTRSMQDKGDRIDLGRGVAFDKNGKYVLIQNTKIPLKLFATTKYDKDMKLQITTDPIEEDGELYAIFMSDYRQLLLLDEQMFYSTFVQLFIFENYDKRYFSPIILSPFAKVYKVMR